MSAELIIPETVDEARSIIKNMGEKDQKVRLCGARTRFRTHETTALSTVGLNGLKFFDPDDLVVGVEAGMSMVALQEILAEKDMMLPVSPWFRKATVGGMLATNEYGPERMWGGGLRDYVIGMEYITSNGGLVRAGGKVVKNVTGYDLSRMMIGSRGGLGLITSANFKVVPIQPIRMTLAMKTEDDDSWREATLKLIAEKVPVDWMQAIFRHQHWTIGLGVSGNQARVDRLCGWIKRLFGGSLESFEEGEEPEDYLYFAPKVRNGGFLEPQVRQFFVPYGHKPYGHVHGVLPPSYLLHSENLWDTVDYLPAFVYHPISGDFHYFIWRELDVMTMHTLEEWTEEGGWLDWDHAERGVFEEFGFCYPAPQSHALMRSLKQKLDPKRVFVCPFYDWIPEDEYLKIER